MATEQQNKGKKGETLALNFLEAQGYQLHERNYRFGNAEIDLIVEKDDCLVFVEVKYRSSDAFGLPETTVSERQMASIERAATAYIETKDWETAIRFDILAILHLKGQLPQIEHFEDAF